MTVKELNRLVEQAYEAAFAYEDDLAAVYRRAYSRAGKHAVAQFVSQAVVSAAFVPPPPQVLATPLSDSEQEDADRVRRRAVEAIVAALAVLGLTDISQELLAALVQRGALNFNDELLRTLRSTVEEAQANGWSADETAQAIQKAFQHVSPASAQMLARTELTTIVNERSLQAAQAVAADRAAPIYKVWETMQDPRVRSAHAAAQDQTVPVAQPFQVGGYPMMYPGDYSAPLSLVAQCRCRISYTETLAASAKEDTLMSVLDETVISTIGSPVVSNRDILTAATITIVTDDDAEPDVEADGSTPPAQEDPGSFRVLLAIEDAPTEDGRLLLPGAVTWREPPLSLMAMDTTGPGGHEGARVAGRIDTIDREGMEVWGAGQFDSGEFGQEVRRMVGEKTLTGNSVDLAVTDFEYRNAAGDTLDDAGMMAAMLSGEPVTFAVKEGVIMASTVCPTPAIGDAEIMLASGVVRMTFSFSIVKGTALTAAGAGLAPLHPPQAWFDDPQLAGPTPLTVTPEGRIYGHAALWNSCHIGEPYGPGICVPPPHSGMSYDIFHHGAVTTAEGVDVPCGQITMSATHADRDLGWKAALAHYENSAIAAADVRAGEDRHGIWVSGGVRPDLSAEKLRELKGGSLSGDWRDVIGRGLEFLGALVVNIPGFPIPRPEARVVASAAGEEQVLALVAAGIVTQDDVDGMSRQEYLRKIESLTYVGYADGFDISQADRDKAAKSGAALPDGSFPITKCSGDGSSAENAIRSQGRANNQDEVVAHIKKRVKALGCTGDIFKKYQ